MREHDWTVVLGWPGYRVYQEEIDERGKKLKLWVRRKKAGLKLICSGCMQHVSASKIHEICEREVRDLPCFEYSTTVVVETYRVKCPALRDTSREGGRSCRVRRGTVNGLRTRWGRTVRARRRGRWRGGWAWQRARYEPLICGTWNGGRRAGGSLPYDRWASMSCTGERRASFSR